MNKDTATKLVTAGIQAKDILNDMLYDVRDELTPEEFQRLRRFVGETFALIGDHIFFPLFREFPELAPPEFSTPQMPPEDNTKP